MAQVTYVQSDGTERCVALAPGTNLMTGAVHNNIRGIDGECGGCCSCATCHVYLDPAFLDRVAPADEIEDEMLESVASERRPGSRLGCQVEISDALDGLRVTMPPRQT